MSKEEQKKLYAHPECCPMCKKNSPFFECCRECRQKSFLEGCVIGFVYHDAIKKLLLKLKYGHRYSISEYLTEKLSLHILSHPVLKKHIQDKTLAISSIPSHWRRKHVVKGYNQSEMLAESLAREYGLPYVSLLNKKKHTKSQVALTKEERGKNLNDAFSVNKKRCESMQNTRCLLLIDDIITTGSTLQEAAKTLQSSGLFTQKISIRGAVLARKN